MKNFFLSVLVLLLLSLPVAAHSGGTDSNGGHYDRSTGKYHYHHGYPAHQHTNGICPYDFDDQTRESSGASGMASGTISEGQAKDETPSFPFSLLAVISPFVILYVIASCYKEPACEKLRIIIGAAKFCVCFCLICSGISFALASPHPLAVGLRTLLDYFQELLTIGFVVLFFGGLIVSFLRKILPSSHKGKTSPPPPSQTALPDFSESEAKFDALPQPAPPDLPHPVSPVARSVQGSVSVDIFPPVLEQRKESGNPLLSTFGIWTSEIHRTPEQIRKIEKALNDLPDPQLWADGTTAYIQGSEPQPYMVTLNSCTCKSFRIHHIPCKHIYRLAIYKGLFVPPNYRQASSHHTFSGR